MNDLKALIGKMTFIGGQKKLMHEARRLSLGAAKIARGSSSEMRRQVEGMMHVQNILEEETGSWTEPNAIRDGSGGAFDACDLRHWLEIAERADIPFIPAKTVLSLTEDEVSAVDQKVKKPDHVVRRVMSGMRKAFPEVSDEMLSEAEALKRTGPSPAEVADRLFNAMDDVPWDWMVRSNIAGSSMLKALAGSGVIGDGREGAKLAEDVEVGAGWVRAGNRRRIDATDNRLIETFAAGHKPEIHYLARPWMDPARRVEGEDPHRHGAPFAGKAEWPAEWRVFVKDNEVTGVSSYYAWIGEVSPENAARALEAANMAQRIVDEAVRVGAHPRMADIEILRATRADDPSVQDVLTGYPCDSVSCTLDFMETTEGMMLLEGGPAHTPIGGGFPCAFAGHNMKQETGYFCDCTGVALAMRQDVDLGNPKTWTANVTSPGVLSWEQAAEIAAEFEVRADEGPDPF